MFRFQIYLLWNSNYISKILWSFINIHQLEANSQRFLLKAFMKTSGVNKLFLGNSEITYDGLCICATFCGCIMSLSKVVRGRAILHSNIQKGALKSKKWLSAVWRHLSGSSFHRHSCSMYSLVQDAWKHLNGLFYEKISSKRTHFWLLWNLFQCSIN